MVSDGTAACRRPQRPGPGPARLEQEQLSVAREANEVVARFLPSGLPPVPVRVCVTLLASSMTFPVDVDGSTVLVLDITSANDSGDIDAAMGWLRGAWWHELWHARFAATVVPAWKDVPGSSAGTMPQLAQLLLNEGMAHDMSMLAFGGRTERLSPAMAERVKSRASELAPVARSNLEQELSMKGDDPAFEPLAMTAVGGAMWSKWGVVPVMELIDAALGRYGRAALVESMRAGQGAFWRLILAFDSERAAPVFPAQFGAGIGDGA